MKIGKNGQFFVPAVRFLPDLWLFVIYF